MAQAGQKRYVKIVDYKTGLKDLDPDKIREGLQLQLPLYMEAVKRREESLHPEAEVLPAALLYYRMTDPVLNEAGEQEVYKALRPKGLLNGNPEALRLLDNTEPEESLVVPLSRKKDGGMKASSGVMAEADFVRLLEEAGKVACALSEEIYSGRIPKNPRVLDTYTSCTYCPYQGACGFDERLPGCTLQ